MLESLFNLYNYTLVGCLVALIGLEALAPARQFPSLPWWRVRCLAAAIVYFVLASWSPFLWVDAFGEYRLFDATQLPLALSIPIGLLVTQLASYAWHRAMHRSNLLWRTFHQLHHSPERVDIYGSLYFHPLDTVGFTFVGSLALTVGFGMDPVAAAIVGVIVGVLAMFAHVNTRTPRWLGFLVTRPESHCLHHERGRHSGNYGEIILWDLVFGTYENPRVWQRQAGFYDGASDRVGEMLLCRNVSDVPPLLSQPTGAAPPSPGGAPPASRKAVP